MKRRWEREHVRNSSLWFSSSRCKLSVDLACYDCDNSGFHRSSIEIPCIYSTWRSPGRNQWINQQIERRGCLPSNSTSISWRKNWYNYMVVRPESPRRRHSRQCLIDSGPTKPFIISVCFAVLGASFGWLATVEVPQNTVACTPRSPFYKPKTRRGQQFHGFTMWPEAGTSARIRELGSRFK